MADTTMVLELAPVDEEFSAEFDRVFAQWRAALVTPHRAADISALEGALVLSRTAHSLMAGPGE